MSGKLPKRVKKWLNSDSSKGSTLMRPPSELAPAHGSAFMQGYVCAVAEIIRLHDEPTVAKDVLRGIGNVNWDS